MEKNGAEEEEGEQDGLSMHSPCQAPPSSVSSLPKLVSEVQRLFEKRGPFSKNEELPRMYAVVYFLCLSLGRHFSPDEVLQLLDHFYNLEMLKPDEGDIELLSQEEDFLLPPSFLGDQE